MSKEVIRKALPREAERIRELVDYYARQDEMLPLSMGEVYERLRDFNVCVKNEKIIGCCALHISWEDLAEIRSLAVEKEHKGKGIGSKLVKECLTEAKKLGLPKVFTLTNKPDYFKKLGFKKISKDKLPMKVWGECIHCNKYTRCDEEALIHTIK
jgi:amino-acid N-acetyltransferase